MSRGSCGCPNQSSGGSKEAVKTAKAFLDKKEYDRARFACENALVLDPLNVNLLLLHGKACTGLALVRVQHETRAVNHSPFVGPVLV